MASQWSPRRGFQRGRFSDCVRVLASVAMVHGERHEAENLQLERRSPSRCKDTVKSGCRSYTLIFTLVYEYFP